MFTKLCFGEQSFGATPRRIHVILPLSLKAENEQQGAKVKVTRKTVKIPFLSQGLGISKFLFVNAVHEQHLRTWDGDQGSFYSM